MTTYLPFFRAITAVAVSTAVKSGRDLYCAVLRGADLRDADLAGADLAGADLRDAVLTGADLAGADLRDAVLTGADLRDAVLARADLRDAALYCADLRRAVLARADLSGAYLRGAVLRGAVLRGAVLRGAVLRGAVLTGADLRDAVLAHAVLRGAVLADADLRGTCLDPAAPIPAIADEEIAAAGLTVDGDRVCGWRTRTSQHCGSTVYGPGTTHRAPWFSVAATDCHPGIYLAGLDWLRREYPHADRVRVSCRRCDLHHVGDKWRAREIVVEAGARAGVLAPQEHRTGRPPCP